MQTYLFDILTVLFLILINGVLAMAELAIVSSKRIRMENIAKKSNGAKAALELMDNPGALLSTVQIGITIIGVISGAFSGQKFAGPLGAWLKELPLLYNHGEMIAFFAVVAMITYVSIVFGELLPKRIAMTKPEKLAIILSRPIKLLSKITHPLVLVLDSSTKMIMRLFGQNENNQSKLTTEEINCVIQEGLQAGAIDHFEHQVFQKVLQFGDRPAKMMMTPTVKVTHLDLKDPMEKNINKIMQHTHSYYPVFDGGLDNFKGVLKAKNALKQIVGGQTLELQSLIMEAPCIIENSCGPELLELFRKHESHVAIVVDEYGCMQGVVTLFDLFATLICDVPDMHHHKNHDIIVREDGSWICEGLTAISDIEQALQIPILKAFKEPQFNTLAGFLLSQFKQVPDKASYTDWGGFRFEIVDMDGKRIDQVLITKL